MVIRAFITHKLAESFADCQDRFGVNPNTKSIAVSDGMGATWQQKKWAQLLVDTFISNTDWYPNAISVKPLCSLWRKSVVDFINDLKIKHAPINIIYRSERNLAERRSAGATFVGIRIVGNQWNGSVLGDSCLIEWDGSYARFHTSQDVEAFDSYPDYFDSDELKQGKGTPKAISGTLDKGGCLFLVSDPFSDFLLEHNKQGDISEYIQQLLKLSSHDEFEALVDNWRVKGMHNDDTTLVIVEDDQSELISTPILDDLNSMIEKERKENEKQKESSLILVDQSQQKIQEQQKNQIEIDEPKDSFCLTPINKDIFRVDFLTEYRKALEKGHPHTGMFRFKWTQRAIIEAVNVIFNKYSIFIK